MKEQTQGRIFHLEDNKDIRYITATMLRLEGHEVLLYASTVVQAMFFIPDALTANGINLAILDQNLSDGKKGEEVAERIRGEGLQIPILSYSSEEDIKWGDYNISKLDKRRTLIDAVNQALDEFAAEPQKN